MSWRNKIIKVLVVDDSAVVRQVLTNELNKYSDIKVIASASDPIFAANKIISYRPDVITLDVEMPRMDGLTFLKKLMSKTPVPTIIVSSLTPKGGELAIEALNSGAVDVICKPGASYTVGDIISALTEQIRAAAKINMKKINSNVKNEQPKPVSMALSTTTNKIIAIGASTGGTAAIESFLMSMPPTCPGIVIVQHMPERFTKSFADRLNKLCEIEVREAQDGDHVMNGKALIAPGNHHMILKRSGAQYFVSLKETPPVFHQRPSVEVLFNSVAMYAGRNAVGVILTGMGIDGAQGLLTMKNAGAVTFAQDEESSIVWGMPGEAVKIGAADHVLPLNLIPEKVLSFIKGSEKLNIKLMDI